MPIECRADLAGVAVGDGRPVAVVGALNVSPESFHPGSVFRDEDALLRAALGMAEAGAAMIDVGARSTAPYGTSALTEEEETRRLARAVERLAPALPVPVSADTTRAVPARAALDAGARVLNDVSGLRDADLAGLAATRAEGVILMASPAAGSAPSSLSPVDLVAALLGAALERARKAGIADGQVVLDPGIGFFRAERIAWHEFDLRILAGLGRLRSLGRPLCVGVSRKSFLGALLDRPDPGDRLAGSLAATAAAVLAGAAVVRTHDVPATRDAVRVAARLRELAS